MERAAMFIPAMPLARIHIGNESLPRYRFEYNSLNQAYQATLR